MSKRKTIIGISLILIVTGLTLFLMDRNIICDCGTVKLWHGQVISSENSQHIFDWYSLTHVMHGLGFFLLLYLVEKITKTKISIATKLLIAVALESGWEILENTNYVINRYRAETISLDYYGDSIINSISDIIAMSLGFWFAATRKIWMSVLLFIILESFLLVAIRDSLLINIIMLIHPIEALKHWQAKG